ncbi:amidase family protein [Paenibacillus thiaminolyticus]|uniref:amidase family protein n=1 Tax=Paenibacillus thiaminolyticus TaxID=49283 RepID=UPI0023507E08|nr:amidase family protein [Paenibacillus thiaminolyticus]
MKRQSIRRLLEGYKKKQFSPVEITREYVREIKNCNPVYNAYITVTKEHALRKAKRLEKKWNRGKNAGMLFGIPLSYKDNLATKDVRTTNGSGDLPQLHSRSNRCRYPQGEQGECDHAGQN